MIKFVNLDERYKSGMQDFLAFHNMSELSFEIELIASDDDVIKIKKAKDKVQITLGREYQVFRALTILKMHLDEEDFNYSESCYFKTGGPMFDGSQANALMNVETTKKILLILAGMGFNMMMLYCEDCYEIPGEPYFGNMRPKYSVADFKDLDDYAYSLGIELIPCIQTLGHLQTLIRKNHYAELSDQPSVLLVGDEKVYELIEKMISTMAECFRSRRIHLGLDEAWGLGLGRYLIKNGYKNRTEIMGQHLERVYELSQKYGFKPMMWCDMFFSSKSKKDAYWDPDVEFDEHDRNAVPEGMGLVYWDYYHWNVQHYESYIDKLKYLSDDVIFAGMARNCATFGSHYKTGKLLTDPALTACKNKGCKEFIATVWGDDNRESSNFTILTQLQHFAEHMYAETPCDDYVVERFEACTNLGWQAMRDIDALEYVPGFNDKDNGCFPITKVLLWQNILAGLVDANIKGAKFHDHYDMLKDKLKSSAEKYPQIGYLFNFYSDLANVLKDKAEAGLNLVEAYTNRDMDTLKDYASRILPQMKENAKTLRLSHQEYFYTEHKALGWEVLDLRYGSLICSIDTAIKRVSDFIDGKISRIEELEEERLSFTANGNFPYPAPFAYIYSASSISKLP